ncbi:GNAT family N-acetyltransferase [Nakamurella flava]|uniref:GNAT family N-acetyltransferase n=1 Tax=Nakamurella flava TaxID=2576308 RepID=A0A4U6QL63_9ACTN|nr:GNAT family N-acetyltransferase [Nakamurella flava]TKV61244.1 GNAT family N-acetyltransferase [Nakamurella flava]
MSTAPHPDRPAVTAFAAPSPGPLPVVPLTDADVDDLIEMDQLSFNYSVSRAYQDRVTRRLLDPLRFVGVRDHGAGNVLVAASGIYSWGMTFPGDGGGPGTPAAVHPVAAVTWVAVRTGWRGRGLLRAMMRAQLDQLHDGGEAVAILTASEPGLYGRYGYGSAIPRNRAEIAHSGHGTGFQPTVPTPAPLRELTTREAAPLLPSLWDRLAPTMTGHLSRPPAAWAAFLDIDDDDEDDRGGRAIRWAIHPDGFVGYRIRPEWEDSGPKHEVTVSQLVAASPAAFVALWRHLLDLPLTRTISWGSMAIDDPLPDLLVNPRLLRTNRADHVWLRLVDLPRAIGLRGYRAPARVTVDVRDTFCPWNSGRWLLDLETTGGSAVRTDGAADVVLDIADLGATFLGGTPLARLVAAGRVTGDPTALATLGLALSTPLAPSCPEGF